MVLEKTTALKKWWKKSLANNRNLEKDLDDEEKIGVILVDLSKAFDTLNHSLLFPKLDGYPEHLQIKQSSFTYAAGSKEVL